MIHIRVPATSANLGAGFDALGLALTLYNEIEMEEDDRVRILTDTPNIPCGETNLVYQSAKRLYDLCGKRLTGLFIRQKDAIPMTRGLGSSSACIIAGLTGANLLLGEAFTLDDLVDLSAQIEGHPDNTAPALLGGIVTSVFDGKKVHWVRQFIYSHLHFVAIIPDFPMSTQAAREALPQTIAYRDAVHNLSRAALFSASLLSGKFENLRTAVDDRLHQPYRLPQIPYGEDVIACAYRHGAYASYLSGAGPTLMAIVSEDTSGAFEHGMRGELDVRGLNAWRIIRLAVDNTGAVWESRG